MERCLVDMTIQLAERQVRIQSIVVFRRFTLFTRSKYITVLQLPLLGGQEVFARPLLALVSQMRLWLFPIMQRGSAVTGQLHAGFLMVGA